MMYPTNAPLTWHQSRVVLILVGVFIALQLLLLARRPAESSEPREPINNDHGLGSQSTDKTHTLWIGSDHVAKVHAPSTHSSEFDTFANWDWNVSRDSHNPALSHEQCHIAFPKLYYQINQSSYHWQSTDHAISEKDINLDWCTYGCMRLLIYQNELRVLETKDIDHYEDQHDTRRAIAVLSQIHRALLGASANGEVVPNIEFTVSVRDYVALPEEQNDSRTIWSFNRKIGKARDDRLWLMPDFNFWSWERVDNSYSDARRRALTHDAPMADKIPKIAWRGDVKSSRLRTGYLRVTEGKPWADNDDNWIDIDDFCSYLFNAYIEGMAWSGRLKYLLACDSVAVVHELLFMTSYYHLLVPSGPEQNYMSVGRRWSNLEEKIKYFIDHPKRTQGIIRNSIATFRDRYTTPAAEACYWRELFRGYAQVAFDPEPFELVDVNRTRNDPAVAAGGKKTVKHLRGMAYELWLTMDHRRAPPPPAG